MIELSRRILERTFDGVVEGLQLHPLPLGEELGADGSSDLPSGGGGDANTLPLLPRCFSGEALFYL